MNLNESCQYFLAILDGKYGWLKETIGLIALVIIFNFFIKKFLKKLHQKFSSRKLLWQDSFVSALYQPLSYYIWILAFLNAFNIISEGLLGKSFFESIHLLLAMGGILAFAWFLLRWKSNAIELITKKEKKHYAAMEASKVDIIGKLITVIIIFVTLLLLLEISGRSMNTLIAFGGVGGLAIAIASQEIIGNFFGGVMIYMTQPFSIGDWIKLTDRDIEGHVEEIGWYMTRIRTFDKRPLYVPNSIFSKIVLMNPSRMSHRQIKEIIGIRYRDMPALKSIITSMRQMLLDHPEVDHNQRVIVNFNNFGSHALEIIIDVYILTIDSEKFAYIKEDILLKIADILVKYGADMPFPTTVVEIPEGIMFHESTKDIT
jgi:MscS family membrane protein